MYVNLRVCLKESKRTREAGRREYCKNEFAQALRVTGGHSEEHILKLSYRCLFSKHNNTLIWFLLATYRASFFLYFYYFGKREIPVFLFLEPRTPVTQTRLLVIVKLSKHIANWFPILCLESGNAERSWMLRGHIPHHFVGWDFSVSMCCDRKQCAGLSFFFFSSKQQIVF